MKRLIVTTVAGLLLAGCSAAVPDIAAADIPAAFIDITQAPARTMHMEWQGTASMGQRDAAQTRFSATFDFAGEDYAGTMTLDNLNGPEPDQLRNIQIEMAFVGGRTFQRSAIMGSGNWETVSGPERTLDPLRGLDLGDLAYVGPETLDGTPVHHLKVTDVEALTDLAQMGLAGFGGNGVAFDSASSSFDVYVGANAQPIRALVRLSTGSQPDDFGAISLESTYDFSNWNAEIYIVSPL